MIEAAGQSPAPAPGTTFKAAVIGAGAMGSGIAAQFANAGVEVLLLDIVPAGAIKRDVLACDGIDRQLKVGGFMHPRQAQLVTPGNIEDDLERLADSDWIVEAIVEDVSLKRDLFRRIEGVRRKGSLVSSNTSTLRLSSLIEGLGPRLSHDFSITHFFNPPRHMTLLEIVAGPDMSAGTRAALHEHALHRLGKTVVECRDTPGFIANRIGAFWMSLAAVSAIEAGLTVEQADALAGVPFGIPKTGVFGLFDLVGIDLVPSVWASLLQALPVDDAHQAISIVEHKLFREMLDRGLLGRKSGSGFYRVTGEGSARLRETLDLTSLTYRPEQPYVPRAKTLVALTVGDDAAARFTWAVIAALVSYSASIGAEIADNVAAIDTALRLGYGWSMGPFELADHFGVGALVRRLRDEGRPIPVLLAKAAALGGFYPDSGALSTCEDILPDTTAKLRALPLHARSSARVSGNASASLWDLGDGIACFKLQTKMNVIDPDAQDALEKAIEDVGRGFRGLVIGSDHARAFSSGADLRHFVSLLRDGRPGPIERFILHGQTIYRALQSSAFPVVGAGFGLALGGGCELLLHCDRLVVHAELTVGLPEPTVGLLPSWGGCVQMLRRAALQIGSPKGPMAAPGRAFEVILGPRISGSALEARDLGYLYTEDRIVMSRNVLLSEAKREALSLVDGYQPAAAVPIAVAGSSGFASLMNVVQGRSRIGQMTEHDVLVASVIARVLTGGGGDPCSPVSQDTFYALEREAAAELLLSSKTRERIEHMLATGKPLRN